MEEYGADALRLYLINSGLVRAEEQRFADSGVKDMVRRALLPWLNAFKFLNTYAEIDNWQPAENPPPSDNIMDQWILSRLQTLKSNIATEMEAYRLYNVVPALFEFIEELTNWYIRLNRSAFGSRVKAMIRMRHIKRCLPLCMSSASAWLRLHPSCQKQFINPCAAIYRIQNRSPCIFALIQKLTTHSAALEQAVSRMQHIIYWPSKTQSGKGQNQVPAC